MIKLLLTLILVNSPIHTPRHLQHATKTLKRYAAIVGVDLKINVKKIRNSSCNKYLSWDDKFIYRECITSLPHPAGIVHYLRKPFKLGNTTIVGGLASICSPKTAMPNPSGLSTFTDEYPQMSNFILVHEVFHQLGAQHSSLLNNVMTYTFDSINFNQIKRLEVAPETIKQIGECLK